MAFELIEKGQTKTDIKENEILTSLYTLRFHKKLVSENKGMFMKIYVDKVNKKIGFEQTKEEYLGFKIYHSLNKKSYYIQKNTKLTLPKGRYIVEKEKERIIISFE